jgi:hypothetical protein
MWKYCDYNHLNNMVKLYSKKQEQNLNRALSSKRIFKASYLLSDYECDVNCLIYNTSSIIIVLLSNVYFIYLIFGHVSPDSPCCFFRLTAVMLPSDIDVAALSLCPMESICRFDCCYLHHLLFIILH